MAEFKTHVEVIGYLLNDLQQSYPELHISILNYVVDENASSMIFTFRFHQLKRGDHVNFYYQNKIVDNSIIINEKDINNIFIDVINNLHEFVETNFKY